jgi:hypothetical protein
VGNKGAYIKLDHHYQPVYFTFEAVEHPDVKPLAYAISNDDLKEQ